MSQVVNGLHHITAISGSAQRNYEFYTKVLGLRLVKKTVNFDDPGTYHLYYGNERGDAGSAITFFPWENMRQGQIGAGQVSITQYSVPVGAIRFWKNRASDFGVQIIAEEAVFGENRLTIRDPDGLLLALVEVEQDDRIPWITAEISGAHAIRGFRGVTLAVQADQHIGNILVQTFGYSKGASENLGTGVLQRYHTAHSPVANIVDLHIDPKMARGVEGKGTVHHVAFSVPDRRAQSDVRTNMERAGLQVTHQIDRDYFWAIYARTPEGILFEVATKEPGFTVDEPLESLGKELKLPTQHEHLRERIMQVLPELDHSI